MKLRTALPKQTQHRSGHLKNEQRKIVVNAAVELCHLTVNAQDRR